MTENLFRIPQVERFCSMRPDIVCPFSYEHTKNLAVNGCLHADSPTEYFAPVCQNCVKINQQFAQIIAQMNQPIPTVDTTKDNVHNTV